MKIIVSNTIREKLHSALLKAGDREIGGILLGEHIGKNTFKIVDLTIQTQGGSWMKFVRSIGHALIALQQYFERTGHDYKRFNYLGEWHSHPSFEPIPSLKDIQSMFEILHDNKVGANFLVLMIIKLHQNQLKGSASFFTNQSEMMNGQLILNSSL